VALPTVADLLSMYSHSSGVKCAFSSTLNASASGLSAGDVNACQCNRLRKYQPVEVCLLGINEAIGKT